MSDESRVIRSEDFGGSWAVLFAGKLIPIRYRTQEEARDVLGGLLIPPVPTPMGRAGIEIRGQLAIDHRNKALRLGADRAAAYGLA